MRTGLILSLAGMALSMGAGHLSAAGPPNIVWLVGDDVGPLEIGCYGHPTIKTPAIDRLARQGVRYTRAFVTTSSCSPSRASFLTGKYPHATGAENLHDPLPAEQVILPEMLRVKGYYSGVVGKFHLGPATRPKFDRVLGAVDDWRRFLEERPKDRPFFLLVGFHDAHRPFDRGCVEPPTRTDAVVVPPYLPDVDEARRELAGFYDEIRRMDAVIGDVTAWLEAAGLTDETMVVFFGDNGPPFPRAKTTLYDSGIATPLVIRWPGQARAGLVQTGQISTVDLVATTLEAVGLDVPGDVQGVSQLASLTDPLWTGRRFVFAERNWHDFDDHSRAVRTRHYKYIRNALPQRAQETSADSIVAPLFQRMRKMRDAGTLSREQMLLFRDPRPSEELYVLDADPWEFRNVAADPAYASVLSDMRSALDDWVQQTRDVPPSKALPDEFDRETGKRIRPPHPRPRSAR